MAVFSITEIRNFRRCREQWDLTSANRQNLTKIGVGATQLELGSLIHRALAQWILEFTDENPGNLKKIFYKQASLRLAEAKESYRELVGTDPNEHELGPLLDCIELGANMMQNYQLHHKRPIPENMRFAAAEQEILVPVPGTEHQCECVTRVIDVFKISDSISLKDVTKADEDCTECNGTGTAIHQIRATLDGLLQDDRRRLFVLEHKTYDNRPKMDYLVMDDQFTGYAWVASQIAKEMGTIVAGIAYDGMWKREKPPYMRNEGRPGTMADLFLRKPIYKSPEELELWGNNVAKTVNDMANNPYIIPNVPWQGCFDCGVKDICQMKLKGNDPTGLIRQNYTQNKIVRVQGVAVNG